MAVVRVQNKGASNNLGTASLPVTLDAAPTIGNVLVAFASNNTGTSDAAIAGGWTTLGTAQNASGVSVRCFRKVVTGVMSATVTATSAGGVLCDFEVVELRGVDTTTPEDASASTNTQNTTTAPVLTGVTDVTPGSYLIGCIAEDAGTTITKPPSMALIDALLSTAPQRLMVCDETSDTTSNRTGTMAPAGDCATILVRMRPAPVAASSFANVRAFQEYEDPDAFQQSAFQRPDPALAFQEFKLQPEAFQPNAFQEPTWIQAFQDTAFDDEGFQEAAEAFHDLGFQGDAFQQDERPLIPGTGGFLRIITVLRNRAALIARRRPRAKQILRSRVFAARPRPPIVSSEALDRSRRSVRTRRRRPILVRAALAGLAPRKPVTEQQTSNRARVRRGQRRHAIILRALVAAVAPRRPVLKQQTGNRSRLIRRRQRRPIIGRAPVSQPVTFSRPTVQVRQQNRRAQIRKARRRPPVILRAPSTPTATPLVRRRLVIELDRRASDWMRLGRGRRRKPIVARAPQPAAPPAPRPRLPIIAKRARTALAARLGHDQPRVSRSRVEPRPPTRPTLVRRLRSTLVARRRRKQPIIVRPVRSVQTRPNVHVHEQLRRRRPRHRTIIFRAPVVVAATGVQPSGYGDVLVSDAEKFDTLVGDSTRFNVAVGIGLHDAVYGLGPYGEGIYGGFAAGINTFIVQAADGRRFLVIVGDEPTFDLRVEDEPGV